MVQLEWAPLTDDDLPAVAELAGACLAVDGGLPALTQVDYLRRLFRSGPGLLGRDVTNDVVAAAALFLDSGVPAVTGLVHPSIRRAGVGEQLAEWVRGQSPDHPLRLVIENDSPAALEFASRIGLVLTASERVMRHRLKQVPHISRPDGLTVEPWRDDTVELFHRAWSESFGTQPGFTPMSLGAWRRWVEAEPTFRPDDSRVALEGSEPAGFVVLSDDWLDQVGVVPAWRGRALGAHLVVRSLSVLAKAGSRQAWLCVGAENPAKALHERLGFRVEGTRARYSEPPSHLAG